MKKTYQRPTLKTIRISMEHVIAGSDNTFQIGIDSDSSIDHESDIWANKESDHSIWQ